MLSSFHTVEEDYVMFKSVLLALGGEITEPAEDVIYITTIRDDNVTAKDQVKREWVVDYVQKNYILDLEEKYRATTQ